MLAFDLSSYVRQQHRLRQRRLVGDPRGVAVRLDVSHIHRSRAVSRLIEEARRARVGGVVVGVTGVRYEGRRVLRAVDEGEEAANFAAGEIDRVNVEIRRAVLDGGDDLRRGVSTYRNDVPDVPAVSGLQLGVEFVHVVEVKDDGAATRLVTRRDMDVVGRARGGQPRVVEMQDGLGVAGEHPQVGRTRGTADGGTLRREVRGVKRADRGGGDGVAVLRQHIARHDAAGCTDNRGGRRSRGVQQVTDGQVARRGRCCRCCGAPHSNRFVRRRATARANAGWSGWNRSSSSRWCRAP